MSNVRVAVVGAGISGLGAAYLLSSAHQVDVFEREPRLGGHAHTHNLEIDGRHLSLDTGFLVYNTRTYPHFTRLLDHLGVQTTWSDMSFSVRCRRCALEYGSRHVGALFAQRRRLVDPAHWRLLLGMLRFFRAGRAFLAGGAPAATSLGAFLDEAGIDTAVVRHFVLPMTGAIWSASFEDMRSFPARSILQFLDNHGLLTSNGAPRWRTIAGGSQHYVRALADRVSGHIREGQPVAAIHRDVAGASLTLRSGEVLRYDKVVLATHADEALALLADPSDDERDLLSRFRYSVNATVLHTDAGVLPRRRAAWASWNCDLEDCEDARTPVSMTYHLNRLQSVTGPPEFCVTLNGARPIRGVLATMSYAHPILDRAAVEAQPQVMALSGTRHTYYCGAHLRHGFHEDGFFSAVEVAKRLGGAW